MNEKFESARLLETLLEKSGLYTDAPRYESVEWGMITESMKRHGGATVAYACLGFVFQGRHVGGCLDATEPWMFPERFTEIGRRWCGLNPDAEREEAICQLERVHPEPSRPRLGFDGARRT